MDIYNISDCPLTGLKRKVEELYYLFDKQNKQVKLGCLIQRYENDNGSYGNYLGDKKSTPDYEVAIVADNNTIVNIVDGSFATELVEGVSIGEYDYFKFLETQAVVVEDLKIAVINRHDLLGKFNV